MGAPESISIRAGLGPICTDDLVVAGVISTTAFKPALQLPTDAAIGMNRTLKVKIVNPNASVTIAWALVQRGAAAPAIVATYGAGAGSHILPGTAEFLSFDMSLELVLVADGAGNYSVTSIPF
jgi:hypothetical protein